MTLYFPIAEMSLNILLLLAIGGFVGFLSGMFGIGGGFLLTPLMMVAGIAPPVAVATGANQIAGASVSGAMAHLRRGGVDFRMGAVLIAGGAAGSYLGALLFAYHASRGQADLFISLAYVLFLGGIGGVMLWEYLSARRREAKGLKRKLRKRHPAWIHAWPLKMRFQKSRLVVSILIPLLIGAATGILAAIMGVGGGFLLIPALIYILGMPANVVVGTSLVQIVAVTALVAFLHSVNTQTVDALMALTLLAGGVAGAQMGAKAGYALRADQFRLLLALLVLSVGLKMAFDLVVTPRDLFSVVETSP